MSTNAEELDELIAARMREGNIPGLSLAIIRDGRIAKAQGHGVADKTSQIPVTPDTLFQAASISKVLAALAALRLVEEGRLFLDEDVNNQLLSWKVPENARTKTRKVTLRGILSHTAGLTVHGFPGYATDSPVPTLVEILDGKGATNTEAVRVNIEPGGNARYSGGGYTVLQLLIEDVTGQPFSEFMRGAVLKPLGMASSTFDQPLPQELADKAATGHHQNGRAVTGRWHVYPEMAAAGLWTTASDLARCAIGIQQSLAGKSNKVISQSMTRQMLTRQADNYGLGVLLEGGEKAPVFHHGGRNCGFDSVLVAQANSGNGVAALINSNDDSKAVVDILKIIAKYYHPSRN
jgi:CubicO group peptidase (beta-lactamase class C family)